MATTIARRTGGHVRLSARQVVLVVLALAFVLLTLGVVVRSPLLTLDRDVFRLDLRQHYPAWFSTVHTYVMLGQRGPSTLVALPWFLWRAWKSRSARPLIMLGTALFVLNLSVGVVKLATGRLGPMATHQVHAVFDGGDIFPSGHVSNAVVLYGVAAMLAVSLHRTAIMAAAFISLTVGLSTIYLDTHWLTDVLGGWLAGGLVLIVLPWLTPIVERLLATAGGRAVSLWLAVRPRPELPPDLGYAPRHEVIHPVEETIWPVGSGTGS